jgi:hypothetical protein
MSSPVVVKIGFILVAPDAVVGDFDAAVEKMPHCELFLSYFWFRPFWSRSEPLFLAK